MFWQPSDFGRSVIKSIEISDQIRSGIGSGFKNPCLRLLQDLLLPQPLQLLVKVRTSRAIPGQKNCRATKAYVPSLPGWPAIKESWVVWMILVRNVGFSGTQRLPRNRTSPFFETVQSRIDTLSFNLLEKVL